MSLIPTADRLPADGAGAFAPPQLVTTPSVYGDLVHMPPLPRLSATPARWTMPPTPPGSSPPEWLAR